jgi:flagellar protein FlaF
MHYASKAYGKIAREVAGPRELEASLLLKAAARLQAVQDNWHAKPNGLAEALLYNRRLWLVFMDAAASHENRLPVEVRQNILNLSVFVMGEIYSLMTKPKPEHLANLIKINRSLATGLSDRSHGTTPERAA